MATCEHCSAELKEGAKFCEHCGSPATATGDAAGSAARPPEQSTGPETAQPAYSGAAVNGQTQGSYTPPAQAQPQGSYTSPAQAQPQGSYTPPSQAQPQGSYTPPTQAQPQGSYTPPTQAQPQGGYIPPAQAQSGPQQPYYGQQTAVKEKKPIDKKILIFGGIGAAALILIIVLVFSLAGGGGKGNADPYLGVWLGDTAQMDGYTLPIYDFFGDGASIELKPGGKCTLIFGEEETSGTWKKSKNGVQIKAGGYTISCLIDGGTLTIEDYLDMGFSLTFIREGGQAGPGVSDRPGLGGSGSADKESAQSIWNGSWYGYLWITEAYGDWVDVEDYFDDAYMVIDIDKNGEGTMAIFIGDEEEQTIDTYIFADENHFEVTDGVFWDMELDPNVWWHALSPVDDGNLIIFSDTYVDPELSGGDGFDYMFCFRPFGELWTQEEESGDTLPPGYDDYAAAIKDGVTDPNANGSGDGGSPAPGGDERMDENDSWGAAYYGSGEANFDILLDAWKWAKASHTNEKLTYEEICEKIGVKGQYNADVAKYVPESLHVKWHPTDAKGEVSMTFVQADDGNLYYKSGSTDGDFVGR